MTNHISLLYSSPKVYHVLMHCLYGRNFEDRYRMLAVEVPAKAQVLDVCAGDAYLYRRYLHAKEVDYLALDLSPQMVHWVQRKGVNARVFDLRTEEVPPADVVILQASLYQFAPDSRSVLKRLLAAARTKLIIAEPVVNLSSSGNPILAWLGNQLSVPSSAPETYSGQRFNPDSFTALLRSFSSLSRYFYIPGGREIIGVFNGKHID